MINLFRNSPAKVYGRILKSIDELIKNFENDVDNEEFQKAQIEAYGLLQAQQEIIRNDFEVLKRNSEWKKFTIAFYGETNAGKSTIIEALRIILGEPQKVKSDKKFKKILNKEKLSQEDFETVRNNIIQLGRDIEDLKNLIQEIQETHESNIQKEVSLLETLKKEFLVEKENRNFKEIIIFLFKTSQKKKEVLTQETRIRNIVEEFQKKDKQLTNDLKNNQDLLNSFKRKLEILENKVKPLEEFKDGNIIGDGRSDFTRVNTTYNFSYNGVDFDLIDVPGIEGDEGLVNSCIVDAVQKAHAVFYITRKAAAPQSSTEKIGTLEKIKAHLGMQTEVWTIFNQSINNPNRLKMPLINNDELDSLNNMNRILTDRLGNEHYCGNIILSAYPAFLSVAECLVPGSREIQNQRKFLQIYSRERLSEISGLNQFVRQLTEHIIGDGKSKIIRANYNKAVFSLNSTIEVLEEIKANKFTPLEHALKRNAKDSCRTIDKNLDNLIDSIDNLSGYLVQEFITSAREELYDGIESNISNDSFRLLLEEVIHEKADRIQYEFENEVNLLLGQYQKDVEQIIHIAQSRLTELVNNSIKIDEAFLIELNINIDNGISALGVTRSLITIGASVLTVNIVGIVMGVIDLLSSVWSFFSDSYKKTQQRKAADEYLHEVALEVEGSLNQASEKLNEILGNRNNELKKIINSPLKIISKIILFLEKNIVDMRKIGREVMEEIDK